MEFIQALDTNFLILIHASAAFVTSVSAISPAYNLPVFLFGIYAQNYLESQDPLRLFTGLVGASWLFDLIWLFNNNPAALIKILIILAWMLKIPTFASLLLRLKRSGTSLPGLGDYAHAETVWNMPTSGGAYTSTGGDRGMETATAKPLPSAPSPAPAPPVPTMPHVAQPTQHHHQPAPAAPAAPTSAPPLGTFTI